MGTRCEPPYVVIFIVEFARKNIYPLIKQITMLYLRFTDDIFMIWTKSSNGSFIKTFVKNLNVSIHPSKEFDFKYSKDKIEFMERLVYRDQHQKLEMTLYQKPKNSQNYLDAKSKYPFSSK